jgi:hypothetical protein
MWSLLLVPCVMILVDYLKMPIDTLYFTKVGRPLLGIQNTFRDVIHGVSKHHVKNYPGLFLIRMHYNKIRREFDRIAPTLDKKYYHDIDPWFEKNDNYYFYKIENFPVLYGLVKQIKCIDTSVAAFAVVEGPMIIPPHRAESNKLLRYQLTIHGDGDCSLYTAEGRHIHREGEDILFDHARYHELIKTGNARRVTLILDIHR